MQFVGQVIGWVGMLVLLTAYATRARQSLLANGAMNLVGGIALAYSCAGTHAWAAASLNVVWSIVAIRDVLVALGRRRRPQL